MIFQEADGQDCQDEISCLFPECSPQWFIDKYRELKRYALYLRSEAIERDGGCIDGSGNEAFKFDELAEIIGRLLNSRDMLTAWKTLSDPIKKPKYRGVWEYVLWDTIDRSLRDFEYLHSYGKTSAEKRNSLLKIASKADELRQLILSDKLARSMASELMALNLNEKNISFRNQNGERPEPSVPWPGFDIDCDLKKADIEILNIDLESGLEDQSWQDWHVLSRLSYWTELSRTTTLDGLLLTFSDLLNRVADSPLDIKSVFQ
jgi:hypothetical protein